ncbi:MAG: nuclear transport factor 2 family protein [Daejeonella sp.]|uniref:nuclear transport factor 2 family protein n=1 Tax=Daejeonella sp. TaxID=2805397 RepID=UPI0027341BC8|nr:nuclear transport factor 2 family protein [Daejeonella sp.]MDP3469147.1 nuclear transport factor 2 family protein [Daejeonella sp.]
MKLKYICILITLAGISFSLNAQTKKEQRVVQLVNDFNQAIISTDSTGLKSLVWEDLSYGHSSGLVQDKAAFIAGVMNGPNFFKKFDLQNQTIKVSGKNAVVRHVAIAHAVNQGNPVEIRFGNILIWQKKQGHWKLLARQGYKL